jgi:hypothetical protein
MAQQKTANVFFAVPRDNGREPVTKQRIKGREKAGGRRVKGEEQVPGQGQGQGLKTQGQLISDY